MTRLIVIAACAVIAGCASVSDVVPTGPDTYLLSNSVAGASSGPQERAKALQRATDYCAAQARQMVVVSATDSGAGGPGVTSSAEVQFRCLNPAPPAKN